jgi:hypothetical protein
MPALSFGRFSVSDARGDTTASIVIAPGHILLQREPAAALHDLSYLTIWTERSIRAVTDELAALADSGPGVVTSATPMLAAILRAIAPTGTPTFRDRGSCRGFRARRQLATALRLMTAPLARTA